METNNLGKFLYIYSLPRLIKNKILNTIVSILFRKKTCIDWTGLKVINPKRISIGENFSCGRYLWMESVNSSGSIRIGHNVNISDFVHIASSLSVHIGSGVLIGSKVIITDHSHGDVSVSSPEYLINVIPNNRPIISKGPVVIGNNVWIGDGACILSNVKIGDGAIIGANAVVVDDVPSFEKWAGVPARKLK